MTAFAPPGRFHLHPPGDGDPPAGRHGRGDLGSAEHAHPSTAVAVDVGDGRGALVLRAPIERAGLEVEIHPVGEARSRTHVWVLARAVDGRLAYAAVFPSLDEGRYVVLEPDGSPSCEVEVASGEVAFAYWG